MLVLVQTTSNVKCDNVDFVFSTRRAVHKVKSGEGVNGVENYDTSNKLVLIEFSRIAFIKRGEALQASNMSSFGNTTLLFIF